MLRHAPQCARYLRLLLELETLGQQLPCENCSWHHGTEVTMGGFRTGRPAQSSAGVREKVKSQCLATQVKACQRWSRPRKRIPQCPVFVPEICSNLVAVFGTVFEGAGELRKYASLLWVPTEQRHDIDRFMMQVEELRFDAVKGKPTKKRKQFFEFTV